MSGNCARWVQLWSVLFEGEETDTVTEVHSDQRDTLIRTSRSNPENEEILSRGGVSCMCVCGCMYACMHECTHTHTSRSDPENEEIYMILLSRLLRRTLRRHRSCFVASKHA